MHGTGIMNTTVNFTYQFLRQRLFLFSQVVVVLAAACCCCRLLPLLLPATAPLLAAVAPAAAAALAMIVVVAAATADVGTPSATWQFLFDDHIKSPLMKDLRYFRQERASLGNRYPFARAERFNRDVRRLGVSADGLTVLDRFRILITEIGNAMGYVRMVRAGGQHFCVEAMAHVPDSSPRGDGADGTAPLSSSAQPESDLGDDARASAAALGRAVEQVAESLDAGDQYFSVLEKVWGGGMGGRRGGG